MTTKNKRGSSAKNIASAGLSKGTSAGRQNKRRRRKKQRFPQHFRTSLVTLILLIVLFFGTKTDAWLLERVPVVDTFLAQIRSEIDFDTDFSFSQHEETVSVDGEMTVHILDVGQGSACLIESEGHFMLYDGGPSDHSSYVVAYLRDQGVTQLDYVIASHYDADHISGLVGALNVYPTETFLCPDYTSDTKIYRSLMEKAAANGCEIVHPVLGTVYTLGEANFTIVAPSSDSYEEKNNRSIGIRLVHGENSFLMLGDAEKESEEDICQTGLTLASDVYLVSHHGSSSSTTQALLDIVRPSVAVISVGTGNSYGHPTEQTMTRLKAAGVRLYRTDLQGTIIAVSDGETLSWNQDATTDFSAGH